MSHYRTGRDFEYRVAHELADDGYETIRAAGSKGKVDLVAFKEWPGASDAWICWHLLFIQCKRRDPQLPPAERAELVRLANIARAVPIVAHQPTARGPLAYRRLTGVGPKDWVEWTPDAVARSVQLEGGMQ